VAQIGGYMTADEIERLTPDNSTDPLAYLTKATDYVIDFLCHADRELMAIEEGFGTAAFTYGLYGHRLSQNITPVINPANKARTDIAVNEIGKLYLQPDHLGSPLLITNGNGGLVRHAGRDAWGNLDVPYLDSINTAGVGLSLLYTNHRYDDVIGKYYAKARHYDPANMRFGQRDPARQFVNDYVYVGSNPVNYIDPDGQISFQAGATIIGGVIGGGHRLFSYISNQKATGEKISFAEAAKQTVIGAGRGAVVGLTASLSPKMAIGYISSITSGMTIRGVHSAITDNTLNPGNIARESLYDLLGGRPEAPSHTANRDPRASYDAGNSTYGYTAGAVGSTPIDKLKHRWSSDPNNMVHDIQMVAGFSYLGARGVMKLGRSVGNTVRNANIYSTARAANWKHSDGTTWWPENRDNMK